MTNVMAMPAKTLHVLKITVVSKMKHLKTAQPAMDSQQVYWKGFGKRPRPMVWLLSCWLKLSVY
jgi:hypothetical protein